MTKRSLTISRFIDSRRPHIVFNKPFTIRGIFLVFEVYIESLNCLVKECRGDSLPSSVRSNLEVNASCLLVWWHVEGVVIQYSMQFIVIPVIEQTVHPHVILTNTFEVRNTCTVSRVLSGLVLPEEYNTICKCGLFYCLFHMISVWFSIWRVASD